MPPLKDQRLKEGDPGHVYPEFPKSPSLLLSEHQGLADPCHSAQCFLDISEHIKWFSVLRGSC